MAKQTIDGGKTDVYKMLTSMQKFERPVALKATGRSNFCIEVGEVEECWIQNFSKFAVTETIFLELRFSIITPVIRRNYTVAKQTLPPWPKENCVTS